MSAPESSVNGPDAASWPLAFSSARYCRCVGRSSPIFALSWAYSMMAANFMACLLRHDRAGGPHRNRLLGGRQPAGQGGVHGEGGVGEQQVAQDGAEQAEAEVVAQHDAE